MSVFAEIDSLKEQIEEARKREEGVVDEPEEIVEEEVEEAAPEAEKEQEADKEEEKPAPEPEKKTEEALDDAAYARIRRENAANKRALEEARRELEELRTTKQQEQPEFEADQPVLPPEIAEILRDHKISKAEREFLTFEAAFKAQTPDYDAVAAEYVAALAQSVRLHNPRMPMQEVAETAKVQLLKKAGELLNQGYENPVGELYHLAKELGYNGASFQRHAPEPKEETKPEPRPDMAKVAANRQRSAGMAGSGGESRGQMTKQAASELSPAEWAKLNAEDKKRLLYG